MSDTPTPRTDAAFKLLTIAGDIRYNYERRKAAQESARNGIEELERELQQKDAQIAALESRLNHTTIDRDNFGYQLDGVMSRNIMFRKALRSIEQCKSHPTDKYVKMCPLCDCVKAWDEDHKEDCAIGQALSSPPPPVVPLAIAEALRELLIARSNCQCSYYGPRCGECLVFDAFEPYRAKQQQRKEEWE